MPVQSNMPASPEWAFGMFVLHRAQRVLLKNGQAIRLGGRAFDLLSALVERAGEVLSRAELEACVWPDTVVEETSLRVHIAALRKALGGDDTGYITNIPGRGYCFNAPVIRRPASPEPAHNLPARLLRVLGRDEVTAELATQLAQQRLVSLIGPGGIGKTTVAMAVALRLFAGYEHGARFVDFAPLSDASLAPAALAAALGVAVPADQPLPALGAFLRDSHMLIVLDNCEHVIEAAALLAESVLRAAPGVRILATSRESLGAEGECVHRLPALALPGVSDRLSTEQALAFPAVALFVERAAAHASDFALSPSNLPLVRQLCQQLDGIPLAIELAAGRVGSLGVQELAARLEDLFGLLTRGRRTALPRHHTLQAVLDWSHALLADTERTVLRRLSVFRSGFSIESAAGVASCERINPAAATQAVLSLCEKSLIQVEALGDGLAYRLLYMTRAYATDKLIESGESAQLARRHAEHFCERLTRSIDERDAMPAADWLARHGPTMDDVRAGLDWAFSPGGDGLLAVQLTVASLDLVYALGLRDEYAARVALALRIVPELVPAQPALDLRLCAAWCTLTGISPSLERPPPEVFTRVLALSTQVGSRRQQLEALFSLCVNSFGYGDYRGAMAMTERVRQLATDPGEPFVVLIADRYLAMCLHYLGEHRAARPLIERVLGYRLDPSQRPLFGHLAPMTESMRILLARSLWFEGRSAAAAEVARECVERAVGAHPSDLSHALAMAALPIALWRGEHREAEGLLERLFEHAARHSHGFWLSWARNFRHVLSGRSPPPHGPLPSNPMEQDMFATLDEHMLSEASLARVERGVLGWCAPEILRSHAEGLLRIDSSDPRAEAVLARSLQVARSQSALSWELRSATSLARLLMARGRARAACELLEPVCARFTEGLDDGADLIAARRLLAQALPQSTALPD